MSRHVPLSRRRLLACVVPGALAFPFGAVPRGVLARLPLPPILRVHLGGRSGYDTLELLASDFSCPATLGKACLEALPRTEGGKDSLIRSIMRDVALERSEASAPLQLGRKLRERSRADFKAGRTVTVDGWVLSLTETRFYALSALMVADFGASRKSIPG